MRYLVTGGRVHGADGRFQQVHQRWSLENFDDGYVDAKGRFRVYLPDHPRAATNGYVLRAIVAFEAYSGETVEPGFLVHHKDENRLNDSHENLEKLSHSRHQLIHKGSDVYLVCEKCGVEFPVKKWRIDQRIRETGQPPKFCGQLCFRAAGRSEVTKEKTSGSLRRTWDIRRGL